MVEIWHEYLEMHTIKSIMPEQWPGWKIQQLEMNMNWHYQRMIKMIPDWVLSEAEYYAIGKRLTKTEKFKLQLNYWLRKLPTGIINLHHRTLKMITPCKN